jgi:hypothetical protein
VSKLKEKLGRTCKLNKLIIDGKLNEHQGKAGIRRKEKFFMLFLFCFERQGY